MALTRSAVSALVVAAVVAVAVNTAVAADNDASLFKMTKGTILAGLNQAGAYTLSHEEMEEHECRTLCLLDRGCKAYEVGLTGEAEGDCFLSYDNSESAGGNIQDNELYNLYERNDAGSVLGNFKKTPDHFIQGSNAGGLFEVGSHTAESCAQQCLNDPSCRSFEVGTFSFGGRCLLSYDTAESAGDRFTEVPFFTSWSYDFYELDISTGAKRCGPGTASTTGYSNAAAPGTVAECEQCPVNTFSSLSRTRCVPCPTNHGSPAGSDSIHDCVSLVEPNEELIFEVGDTWHGRFSLGGDNGAVDVEIVSIEDETTLDALIFFHGRTNSYGYLAKARVNAGAQTTATFQFVSWVIQGSTVPGNIVGTVTVEDKEPPSFSGRVTNQANSVVTFDRACSVPPQAEPFHVGDQWVGAYVCDASTIFQTARDVNRLEIIVTGVQDNRIDAIFDSQSRFGVARYKIEGTYDPSTGRASFLSRGRDAWLQRPRAPNTQFITSGLDGAVTDNHLVFDGHVDENPVCACNGQFITVNTGFGSFRAGSVCTPSGTGIQLDVANDWCFVNPDCPDVYGILQPEGYAVKLCGAASCGEFILNRVCGDDDQSALCACNGDTDAQGRGSTCDVYGTLPKAADTDPEIDSNLHWCYVEEGCTAAKPSADGRFYALCGPDANDPPQTTTPAVSTFTALPTSTPASGQSSQASTSATDSTTSATVTTASATDSTTSATVTTTSATDSTTSATVTTASATDSTTSATETTASATDSTTSATETTASANTPTTSANTPTTSATDSISASSSSSVTYDVTTPGSPPRTITVTNTWFTSSSTDASSTTSSTESMYTSSHPKNTQGPGAGGVGTTAPPAVETLPPSAGQFSSSASPSKEKSSGAASGGAVAGIVIGVIVLLVLLALIIIFVGRRRSDSGYKHPAVSNSFVNPVYEMAPEATQPQGISNPLYGGGGVDADDADPHYDEIPGIGMAINTADDDEGHYMDIGMAPSEFENEGAVSLFNPLYGESSET